jgi:hypothetical protein
MQDRRLQNRMLRGIFHGRKNASGTEVSIPGLAGLTGAGGEQDSAAGATGGVPAVQAAFAELVRPDPVNAALPLSNAGVLSQSGGAISAGVQIPELFGDVSRNLDRLRAVTEQQTTILGENTAAVASNTAAKSASQVLASASKAASGFLGGLGALQLLSGIMKLFGAGDSAPQQQPLQKYQAPAAIYFNGVLQNGSTAANFASSGYDRYGPARAGIPSTVAGVPGYGQILASVPQSAGEWNNSSGPEVPVAAPGNSGGPAPTPNRGPMQVTVNVQAMDSRSFLDRSGDIAAAVREAMLNMHSINDVVNDL